MASQVRQNSADVIFMATRALLAAILMAIPFVTAMVMVRRGGHASLD